MTKTHFAIFVDHQKESIVTHVLGSSRSKILSKYDITMMETAKLWAGHSTCSRLSVGCLFARDERILVQGYNGAPAGMPHCDHRCNCYSMVRSSGSVEVHLETCASTSFGCKAVHAEQNGLAWAARIGVSLGGSTVYCTHQPCVVCARLLITAGIARVVYEEPYRLVEGRELLADAGIVVERMWEE